ncbi:hypothetical protein GH714_024719 [Hevea brasiliensis]|uniref:SWIRM domain-containing protein n=1 Tax=Hevea brasiliensis TaxID=3981 RepID=A0A6A6MHQ8_HEVBR|nr:hypothetical protein GH714_024719 [Hevea brasiliensis]
MFILVSDPNTNFVETTHHHPDPRPTRPDKPELDLYTIPSYSSWSVWDYIHETERAGLREFFDGSSITRTPKIYKEYRDFIIDKYCEDPSRRLTFKEIRKSLVGDVTLLHKVFQFLDKWGWINFGANSTRYGDLEREEADKYSVEDGPPNGVRVVAMPNSLKPLWVPQSAAGNAEIVENGFKLTRLTSYLNVFGELGRQKGFVCWNCSESCDSGDTNILRDFTSFRICSEAWDDWDLVAQDVQTKTKLDCISKLIELPFGDLVLSSAYINAHISTITGPDVSAAAAKAAVAALCDETSCPREIFNGKDEFPTNGLWPPTVHSKPERAQQIEDSDIKERSTQSGDISGQNEMPLTLRLRTAIATALGAAAMHAKLLADKEDQEIENLVTTMVETQLKKLHYKIMHFDNLELIMEKEYAQLEDLKESLIEEQINVLQTAITAGMPKWRDHTSVKS